MGKIIFSYWVKLFLEAFRTMWKEWGFAGLLFGLLLSGIYALAVGEQTFALWGILTFAKVLLILSIITWLFFVFKVAATQDEDKNEKITLLTEQYHRQK